MNYGINLKDGKYLLGKSGSDIETDITDLRRLGWSTFELLIPNTTLRNETDVFNIDLSSFETSDKNLFYSFGYSDNVARTLGTLQKIGYTGITNLELYAGRNIVVTAMDGCWFNIDDMAGGGFDVKEVFSGINGSLLKVTKAMFHFNYTSLQWYLKSYDVMTGIDDTKLYKEFDSYSEKLTVLDNDLIAINDSADSNIPKYIKKSLLGGALPAGLENQTLRFDGTNWVANVRVLSYATDTSYLPIFSIFDHLSNKLFDINEQHILLETKYTGKNQKIELMDGMFFWENVDNTKYVMFNTDSGIENSHIAPVVTTQVNNLVSIPTAGTYGSRGTITKDKKNIAYVDANLLNNTNTAVVPIDFNLKLYANNTYKVNFDFNFFWTDVPLATNCQIEFSILIGGSNIKGVFHHILDSKYNITDDAYVVPYNRYYDLNINPLIMSRFNTLGSATADWLLNYSGSFIIDAGTTDEIVTMNFKKLDSNLMPGDLTILESSFMDSKLKNED